jgi:hypothetical protein
MDAKDIRNLQEAYLEVYQEQELDEARKKVKIETNKPVEYKIADIGPGKKEYNVKTSKGWKEEVDLYDIILSHLLDEGYAETPKAAEAIMVNMSEEWRDSIVEEVLDEELTGARKQKASDLLDRKLRDVEILRKLSARKRQKPEDVGSGNRARRRAGKEVKDSTLGISDG